MSGKNLKLCGCKTKATTLSHLSHKQAQLQQVMWQLRTVRGHFTRVAKFRENHGHFSIHFQSACSSFTLYISSNVLILL